MKTHTSEGGIRVPAIIRTPGKRRAGEISDVFSTVKDILPSLLEWAGTEHSAPHYRGREVARPDGRLLVAWLDGADAVHPVGSHMGWELFGRRAVRRHNWKAL